MAYDAFISYSHGADTRPAEAIQTGLQKFAKPWYRRRALSIFRDSTGLAANPGLWSSIVDAMASSEYLIVLCSPYAAASPWVGREIDQWVATKPKGRILPVLVAGELEWSDALGGFDPARSSAAHPVLTRAFTEEPLYVDMRGVANEERISLQVPKFREGIAELAAPLHGLALEELVGEDMRQHRRTLRVAWGAAIVVFLLSIAAVVGAVVAVNKADEARKEAEAKVRIQGELDARKRELDTINADLIVQKSELKKAQNESDTAKTEANTARRDKAHADVLRKQADAAATDANNKADTATQTATEAEGRAATSQMQQRVAEGARAVAEAAKKDADLGKLAAELRTGDAVRRQGIAEGAAYTAAQQQLIAEAGQQVAVEARKVAVTAKNKAQKQQHGTELASEAGRLLLTDGDASRALLLANKASKVSETPATRRELHSAVQSVDQVNRFLHFPDGTLPSALGRISVSPDGKWVAAAETSDAIETGQVTDTTHLYVWRADDPKSRAVTLATDLNCVSDLQWVGGSAEPTLVTVDRPPGVGTLQPDCGGAEVFAHSKSRLSRVVMWDLVRGTRSDVFADPFAVSLAGSSPVDVSPDGRFLVIAFDSGSRMPDGEPMVGLLVYDTLTGHSELPLATPASFFTRPTLSADGKHLLGYDSERRGPAVWNLEEFGPPCGNLLETDGCFAEHLVANGWLGAPEMSPDGSAFAVGNNDGNHIEFLDAHTGALITSRTVDAGVAGFAFDNTRVAVTSRDGRVTLARWRDATDEGTVVDVPALRSGCLGVPSFANDARSRLLFVERVCVGVNTLTFVIDLDNNTVLHDVEGAITYTSPDGRYVVGERTRVDAASETVNSDFELWDFVAGDGTGDRVATRTNTRAVVSPDGGLLAGYRPHFFNAPEAPVEIWRLTPSGASEPETMPASIGTRGVAFAGNTMLVGGGAMASGVEWDLMAGDSHLYDNLYGPEPIEQAPCANPNASARETLLRSALSADANWRAVSHDARTVELVDLRTGVRVALPDLGLAADRRIDYMMFSPHGQTLMVNLQEIPAAEQDACVNGARTGSRVVRLRTNPGAPLAPVLAGRFTDQALGGSGNRLLFTSLDRKSVVVRDESTLEAVAPRFGTGALGSDPNPDSFGNAYVLGDKGRRVAGTNSTGRAVVWATDGREVNVLDPPGGVQQTTKASLFGVRFSPDGTHLAVKTIGQRLVVWDLAHASPSAHDVGLPTDAAARVVYSPGGGIIAVDGTYLFDAATLQQLSPRLRPREWTNIADGGAEATRFLRGPGNALYLLVERTGDTDAVRWRVDLEYLRATSCAIAGRDFTREEFGAYVGGAYHPAPCTDP